jgi:phospholipid N-methyltransferase
MNYLKKLFTTGAVRKTPRRVLNSIAREIAPFKEGTLIIEAGVGLGEITGIVLKYKKEDAWIHYFAFEIDEAACIKLRQSMPQLQVVNESAFHFEQAIPPAAKIDYFISSIPLSFYTHEVLKKFISAIKSHMKQNGKVIIVFSAPWLIPFLGKQLPGLKVKPFFTFPLYFVGVYKHGSP